MVAYSMLPFLLLFISPITISYTEATTTPKQQPSNFLRNLTGHRKGDTAQGVDQLKHYLHTLGYVINRNSTISVDSLDHENTPNTFDKELESALKTYQTNYRLNVTGELDAETVQQLMRPRCGEPDTNFNFKSPRQKRHSRPMGFHAVLHYDFPRGQPRWPDSKTHLTYLFLNSADQLRPTTSRAFQTWAGVTAFSFEEVTDIEAADITIGAFSGDHGDGSSFDGPGGVLAHARAPTDGRLHIDADENWSTDPDQFQTDLESVTVHEIGHLLGLAHSSDEDAVMYAYMTRGAVKRDLRSDDIDGIHALYNL